MKQKRISNITIAVFIIAGLLGFGIFQFFYDEAFPEASVSLEITREAAVEKSREFLTGMGFDLSGYRHVVVFKQSQKSINFLERELGLAQANSIFKETAVVYAWMVRWFKELEEEEYFYSITPDGRFSRFTRTIPERTAGESLSREQALTIAREFIRTQCDLNPDQLEYIEHKKYDRPNRLDRSFTWRLKDFDFGGSQYRYSVRIQGAKIGRFNQWLYIPEEWSREREELAEHRGNLEKIILIFIALLGIASLIFFAWLIYKRDARWKAALLVSGLLGVLTVLAQLNNIPLVFLKYITTESFSSFWTTRIAVTLLSGIGAASAMLFLYVASEGAGRRYMPDREHCWEVLRGSSLVSSDIKKQMVLGYAMAFASFGYVTLFYVLGQRFGNVWVPVEVPISDTFSTYFPSMHAIFIGFTATLSEELLFRLFAIALLIRFTKRPWLAILLSALIWGFGHTGYPQEPIWIRGAELTFAGIIFGWVFYRFGLLTTLTSHYVFNCFAGVVLQFQSGDIRLVLNALVALLIPVAFLALLSVFRFVKKHVKFKSAAKTDTIAEEKPTVPVTVSQSEEQNEKSVVVRPFTRKVFWGVLALSVSILIAARFIPFKDFYGDPPAVQLTQQEAYEKCLSYLTEASIDPEGYTHFTYYRDSEAGLPNYAFGKLGIEETYENFADRFEYRPTWYTKWFREKTIRKYKVGIYDNGQLRSLDIKLADEEKGVRPDSRSQLEESEARAISENHLRSRGIKLIGPPKQKIGGKIEGTLNETDLDGIWKEIEVNKISRPSRVDWRFRFRDESFSLGELESRRTISVRGDQVTFSGTSWYKIPEKWERDRKLAKEHLRNNIREMMKIVLFACFIMFLLVQFFMLLSKGYAQKQDLYWAFGGFIIFGFLPTVFEKINKIPKFYFGYYSETEQTVRSYTLGKLADIPLSIIGEFILFISLFMLLQVFLRAWAPKTGGLASLLKYFYPGHWWKTYIIQGVIIGIGLFLLTLGAKSIFQTIQNHFFPGNYLPAATTSYYYYYQYLESMHLFGKIDSVIYVLINVSFLILAARHFLKKDRFIIPAILLLALFWGNTESLSTSHLVLNWVLSGLKLVGFYLVITRILKWNVMAYITYLWIDTYFDDGIGRFLSSPSEFFRVDVQRLAWLILPVVLVLTVGLWQRLTMRYKRPADQ